MPRGIYNRDTEIVRAGYAKMKGRTKENDAGRAIVSEKQRGKPKKKTKYSYKGTRKDFMALVRKTMFDILGDHCVECGKYLRNQSRPQPHHIIPETKRFAILTESHKYTWEEIIEEINKCELRCHGCHMAAHKQLRKLDKNITC